MLNFHENYANCIWSHSYPFSLFLFIFNLRNFLHFMKISKIFREILFPLVNPPRIIRWESFSFSCLTLIVSVKSFEKAVAHSNANFFNPRDRSKKAQGFTREILQNNLYVDPTLSIGTQICWNISLFKCSLSKEKHTNCKLLGVNLKSVG